MTARPRPGCARCPAGMTKDDGEDFAALLEEFDKKEPGGKRRRGPEVGDLVKGRVISVGREAVFVAIGEGNTEGVLDLAELLDEQGNVAVKEGDVIEARVGGAGRQGRPRRAAPDAPPRPRGAGRAAAGLRAGHPGRGDRHRRQQGRPRRQRGRRAWLLSHLAARAAIGRRRGGARLHRPQAHLQGHAPRGRPPRRQPRPVAAGPAGGGGPGPGRRDPGEDLGRARW